MYVARAPSQTIQRASKGAKLQNLSNAPPQHNTPLLQPSTSSRPSAHPPASCSAHLGTSLSTTTSPAHKSRILWRENSCSSSASPSAPLDRQQQSIRGRVWPSSRHVCRVLTESADMALGEKAPDFELPEPLTGRKLSLSALSSGAKATLVMFICNHCPFVVMLKDAIAALAKEYQPKGVAIVAISSNSTQTHPQDGPDKMAEDAKKHGYTFPYLYDASQSVAKSYKAACTPEFYVFDAQLQLTYHGQFDDSRPNSNKLVTGSDLRTALNATLAVSPLPEGFKARPSIGCNIKWHPGSEPDYFNTQIVK